MDERREQSNEYRRKKLAEELWLNYFNQSLLEQGLISQAEYNRMTALIASRPLRRTPREEGSAKRGTP